MKQRSEHGELGETLLELLVAVTIMGIGVVVVVGGLGTSIRVSDIHRKQATAGAYVRDFGEAIQSAVAATPTAYTDCATTATYAAAYSAPAGYAAQITGVRYWSSTGFVAACTTDVGVQRLTLQVSSADNAATETLDVIIRKPCRPIADFPLDAACS